MDYNGYLIQGNKPKIYLILNSKRHLIDQSHVFNRLFVTRDRIEYLDEQEVIKYEEGQSFSKSIKLVKSISKGKLYLDNDGHLYECHDDMIYKSGLRWLDYEAQ